MKLTCRKRQVKVKNPWIEVYEDEAEYADGRILHPYTVLHYPQASAALVAENAQGQVLLIRSWRYPIQQEGWEIPSGSVETGEDPAAVSDDAADLGMVLRRRFRFTGPELLSSAGGSDGTHAGGVSKQWFDAGRYGYGIHDHNL